MTLSQIESYCIQNKFEDEWDECLEHLMDIHAENGFSKEFLWDDENNWDVDLAIEFLENEGIKVNDNNSKIA